MSLPGTYPLEIYHGDSYRWQFMLWSDVDKTIALDLTDVVAKAEMRNKPGGTSIYAMDAMVVLPNIIEVVLTVARSTALPIGSLVWDLQLTYPTGEVNTVLAGAVTVTQDVTDAVVPSTMEAMAAAPVPLVTRNRRA